MPEHNYQAYGGALDLWNHRGLEVLLAGGADTGKSRVCLEKVSAFCMHYPGCHSLLVRRHRSDMRDTTIRSLVETVYDGSPESFGVQVVGGKNPQEFHYNNGSIIRIRGMDDGSKALGGEYDLIFVSQAEELNESQWNVLSTRATGRAGHTPYPQLLADANPGPPTHFLKHRESLHFIASLHKDNPDLYNQETGLLTEKGKLRMQPLLNLTGVERQRLLEGIWAAAEGIVYDDFRPELHMLSEDEVPVGGERLLVVDFGFTNPLVCQWWYVDPNGRMILTREIYETGLLVEDLAKLIKDITEEHNEVITAIVADHDAEDTATLERHVELPVTAALKGPGSVSAGIGMVKARLRVAADGRPKILFSQNALMGADQRLRATNRPISTEGEFGSYVWKTNGAGDILDEVVKRNDHGMDATRYAVSYVDAEQELDWRFL